MIHTAMLHWALILAADPPGFAEPRGLQVHCMHQLVGACTAELPATLRRMRLLRNPNTDPLDVCEWHGVQCTVNGLICSIRWRIASKEHGDLHWIPSTTQNVDFLNTRLHREALCTRKLPRALRFCALVRCGLHGNVDLRTLPMNLQRLDLSFNAFTGAIHLTALPLNMQRINFRNNKITKVVVCNNRLPPGLTGAYFHQTKRKVRFRCLDADMIDHRVKRDIFRPEDDAADWGLEEPIVESYGYLTSENSCRCQ
ncbi:hypothetical protein XU18_4932 [Perkinsela sp. CCAP 1560/4]|nr:hypothetical protein XU18_4932 [Perkinsela sp. CCAP 1560/4]|eukprot:KNH03737.1 hypothetical protein XU18_4932 [Perkinsela sp. CCAP 1560/4]